MIQDKPTALADLLRFLDFPVPAFDRAWVVSGDLPTLVPTELRADAVVRFTRDGILTFATVYEVQLARDRDKQRTWPAYVANVYAQTGCPVVLLVVAPDRRVATWCARPIRVGEPDFVLTPVVIGPDGVPLVTDAEQARRQPEVAFLSALAHGPANRSVLKALLDALNDSNITHGDLYAAAVLQSLPAAARKYMEDEMNKKDRVFHLDFLQESYERGEAVGEAKSKADDVLDVLGIRGVAIPEDVRERIVNCADVALLATWLKRAVTARTVDDLFDQKHAA
jgi:hypothetical protein